jgi:hypothetical protein
MRDAHIGTYVTVYLAGGFALLAWMAFIDNHRAREAFWFALLWPLTLLLIPIVNFLDLMEKRGWYVDIQYQSDLSPFGFRRRPSRSIAFGWAARFLWWELQVWKVKQEPRP